MSKAPRGTFTLHRGDVVTLGVADSMWIKSTPDELDELRLRDHDQGHWHDSAGEPILYGPYHGKFTFAPTLRCDVKFTVTVTDCRPKWEHYTRRPCDLRAGFCTELNREVLFQDVPKEVRP